MMVMAEPTSDARTLTLTEGMSPEAVAEYLGVNYSYAARLMRSGRIRSQQYGSLWFAEKSDVDAFRDAEPRSRGARRKPENRNLPKGVYPTRSGKYQARFYHDGEDRDLGTYETVEDAVEAIRDARGAVTA